MRYGVMSRSYWNVTLDFWRGLDVLYTRNITIDHNRVVNSVRDTSDAGALECECVRVSEWVGG